MTYEYIPHGVCSRRMEITLDEEGKLSDVIIEGGCDGNLKGIIALVKGKDANEVAEILKDIDCRGKGTSCPAQLSICIKEAMENF